jgi:hypothetical protein
VSSTFTPSFASNKRSDCLTTAELAIPFQSTLGSVALPRVTPISALRVRAPFDHAEGPVAPAHACHPTVRFG